MNNQRLSCADFSFPLLSHEGSLNLIADMGMDGVDIGLFEGRSHLYPSQEFRATEKSGTALKKKVADRGLVVADVFLQMAPGFIPSAINHPSGTQRKKCRAGFRSALEYAVACECGHVTILPGVFFDDVPEAESLALAHEELAWRVERAQEAGIVFAVEAHIGSIAPTPRAAIALVEAVPGLTLTVDYTHFTSRGFPDRDIEPLLQHASHFHARGACEGRLQTSFEHNTIDYERVFQAMKTCEYAGFIGIEYVWIDWEHCNEVDNVSETILLRDFFRKLIKENRDGK